MVTLISSLLLGNTFLGAPLLDTAFELSDMMHAPWSGNAVTLTMCRRSDAELFSFYSSVILGGSRFELPLPDAVKQAKAQLCSVYFARWNLGQSQQGT